MGTLHTHNIHVETDEERVTVQIGGEGSVPGGFAKLFNRVIDSQAWARLSDAGRAAYIPLVRFADQRNQFRVQMGQASLMKYSGLSRSSIKRAIKDLLASRLIVLVEQGGVTADGRNESNLYQLMVPVEGKQGRAGSIHEQWTPVSERTREDPDSGSRVPSGSSRSTAQTRRGDIPPLPRTDPLPVRQRTPSRLPAEPPAGSRVNPESDPIRPASRVERTPLGGVAAGPQLRSISDSQDISRSPEAASRAPLAPAPTVETDAAALLEEKGVERMVARQLAATYPPARIRDVIETMEYRRSRGKCENPGGFIRDALVKQWQTPQAVLTLRAKAEARARAEAVQAQARQVQATSVATLDAEQSQVDRLIDSLDDEELDVLALEVLKKYDGNSAVLSVLTRKPPRQSRLMKMEIAGMMGRK